VVEAGTERGLGFDPEAGSKGGNAVCPFCGTAANNEYVREKGMAKKVGQQLMATVCTRPETSGKVYLAGDDVAKAVPDERANRSRIEALCRQTGLTVPSEPINPLRPSPWTRGASGVTRHGMTTWGDLFMPRQMLCLLSFAAAVRECGSNMKGRGCSADHVGAITAYLGLTIDKLADANNSLCHYEPVAQCPRNLFGRQALPMVWDFGEAVPIGEGSGSWVEHAERAQDSIGLTIDSGLPAAVIRGSAISLPWEVGTFDAVITDPPYYDNVPYADISDFFYAWLKRTIGHIYPEHFASATTPKKGEATALSSRHGGDMEKARREYEDMMAQSFCDAHRVLKPGAPIVVVYAHKTTLGWATLVDALRTAGFTVTEAWPLDTETSGRLLAHDTASLASSIFLLARKREGRGIGQYESQVRPELEVIVRERVTTLWHMGITGADLVIACVGAGLRAFTRFGRVEYANGEQVPAERFLAEVETVVLETILGRLSKEVGGIGQASLAGVDTPTRFYTLWRYTYRTAELDAGEAIVFANGTHVELDGPGGLSTGPRTLVEKKKGKYRLRDYKERGGAEKLGMPGDDGQPAPIVDALQRTLWLMENRPGQLTEFLRQARPNREQMRLVAQALAGPALRGGELADVSPTGELAALTKLLANWKSVIEDAALPLFDKERK
jgi:putative DNA methylase